MSARTPEDFPALPVPGRASRRELFAWAMYDFANSGYTTVVLTAIFNAYFVNVIASSRYEAGVGTFLWTIAMAVSNALVLFSAPVVGAIADHRAAKKAFLAVTTVGCVLATASLGLAGPGEVALAIFLIIVSNLMFGTGENMISAFLPEIATQKDIGRISGYGWSLGYMGGLLVLGACLAYIAWAEGQGRAPEQFVPVTMVITAAAFALASLPTFAWLRERARPQPLPPERGYIRMGFARVRQTLVEAHRFRDLFRFLLTLAVYHCGVYTVVVLAAIYAQQVMGFSARDTVLLILVVNLTAAAGAFLFGHLQDRLGSVNTLALTLGVWIAALVLAYFTETRGGFWLAANLVGVALGSSQSAGRALIGLFTPPGRAAEFFGLWGLAGKLAAIIGPMSYGLIVYLTRGDHRQALLFTGVYFVAGLALLATVNERRGRAAALSRE